MTVTITDENHIPEILKQLEELGKYKVSAGVPGDGKNGMIAAVMEYGATIVPRPENYGKTHGYLWVPNGKGGVVLLKSVTIPARPYIRSTFAEKQGDWSNFAEKLVWQVATGDLTAYQAYNQLGARMARDIKQKITSHPAPANAPLTIANKGGGGTLIDSGHLRDSVTWKVEEA